MADITNLRDAFLDEIRDIYHAERRLPTASCAVPSRPTWPRPRTR